MNRLLAAYLKTLKPLEVEEPIDVWVHRPLAFLVARAAYPTPITPNAITVASILFGLAAGACMFVPFEHHLLWAGALLFWSAVMDCADGQLARLRQSFSAFGRMLDGAADLVVTTAAVAGGLWLVWTKYSARPLWGAVAVALCLLTIVTSSYQTVTYDHYKNLFLRLTHAGGGEGEDYEAALGRAERARGQGFWLRLGWWLYVFYVKSQVDFIRGFDPEGRVRYAELPKYDPAIAQIYRQHQRSLMRWWRSLFGFGSLVFGLSVSIALGVVEYYMLFRLLVLNGLMFGVLRPAQRRASAAALSALGLRRAPASSAEVALEGVAVGK